MLKGLKAKNLGIAEEDIISWFHAYAFGKEVKGLPALKVSPCHTNAMVYLTKNEIVIASGWGLDAVLRIPKENVISVSIEKYEAPIIGFLVKFLPIYRSDVYILRYKTQGTEKEIELMPLGGTLTKNLEANKEYFQPFLIKDKKK